MEDAENIEEYFFFIPGLGCHRGVSLPYEEGSHRPIINIKFSLTLASKPTFAHIFLSTPRDVQPDKKFRADVSVAVISPATSGHPRKASIVTWRTPTRGARSPVVPRQVRLCPHYQSFNLINHAPPLSPIPTCASSSG